MVEVRCLIYDANKTKPRNAVSELLSRRQTQASPIVGLDLPRIPKLVDSRLNGQLALLLGSAAPSDKTLDSNNPALSNAMRAYAFMVTVMAELSFSSPRPC